MHADMRTYMHAYMRLDEGLNGRTDGSVGLSTCLLVCALERVETLCRPTAPQLEPKVLDPPLLAPMHESFSCWTG